VVTLRGAGLPVACAHIVEALHRVLTADVRKV
jgi:uncharacterized protein with von Willebrand factor type A (vWA) domain